MNKIRVIFLREVLEWRMRAVWKTAVEMRCTAINRGFDSHPLYTYEYVPGQKPGTFAYFVQNSFAFSCILHYNRYSNAEAGF